MLDIHDVEHRHGLHHGHVLASQAPASYHVKI
jgi:hypothetical protein